MQDQNVGLTLVEVAQTMKSRFEVEYVLFEIIARQQMSGDGSLAAECLECFIFEDYPSYKPEIMRS
jgi:hypothetical protein